MAERRRTEESHGEMRHEFRTAEATAQPLDAPHITPTSSTHGLTQKPRPRKQIRQVQFAGVAQIWSFDSFSFEI